MANMSFFHTQRQFLDQTKDITRRLGWWYLVGGEIINGIQKGQGLKRGEKVVVFGPIKILDARGEPLEAITPEDVVREGFRIGQRASLSTSFAEAWEPRHRRWSTGSYFSIWSRLAFRCRP